MPPTGQKQLEALQKDLACPNCEYNLRGLYGDTVNCPECGEEILIPQLQQLRLSEKWGEVPGYPTLAMPGIVIALILMVLTVRFNFRETLQYYPEQKFTILVVCGVLSVVWLIMMGRVWYVFRSIKAIPLIITAQLIWVIGVYTIFVLLVGSPILLISLALAQFDVAGITAAVLGVMAFLYWLITKVEKWVVRQCIRIHNIKETTSYKESA